MSGGRLGRARLDAHLPPTPRRLREARRRGEVAFSRDLTSAAALAAAVGALAFGGAALAARWVAYFRAALGAAVAGDGPPEAALAAGLGVGARALAPPLLAAVAVALAAGALQTRGAFAPAALAPDLGRLSAGAGWRRLASGRALGDAGRGLLGLGLLLVIAWTTLQPLAAGLAALTGAPPPRVLAALGVLGARLALRLAAAGVALGALDFLVARARHLRALRMTREEVERDRRETEGDPAYRAQRRRLHRALAAQPVREDVRRDSA